MIDIEDFKKSIEKKSRLLGIDPGKNSSKRRSKNIFVKLICQSFYLLVSYLTSYCAADVFNQVITLTILQLNPVNMNIKLKIKSLFKIW